VPITSHQDALLRHRQPHDLRIMVTISDYSETCKKAA